MTRLVKHVDSSLKVQISHDANFVRSIVLDALDASFHAGQKCLLAGYFLGEQKARLGRTSHDEKSSVHGRNQHSDEPGWLAWLAANIPEISQPTAYRWMSAAATVAIALKMRPPGEALPAGSDMDVASEVLPISRLLTMPEAEVPEASRKMRQDWFDFTAHKTIKECLSGVLIDGEPEAGMKRAVNGKGLGGAGRQDRKEFGKFFARALGIATSQVALTTRDRETDQARWAGDRELPAAEQAAACAGAVALAEACRGAWPVASVRRRIS